MIKIYRDHPDFPGKGKFTQALEKLNVGDHANFEGPIGMMKYEGRGKFNFKKTNIFEGKTKICLLAGGTGITPCLSVAQASILAGEGIEVKLINSNKTQEDILCGQELIDLAAKDSTNFKFANTVTRVENPQNGLLKGRISAKHLKDLDFPAPAPEVFFMWCGPGEFGNHCRDLLLEMGYEKGTHFI